MLSNRITLAVAHYYMSGTQNNYYFEHGPITDIKMSYVSELNPNSKLVTFKNLVELADFIDNSVPSSKNVAHSEADCYNMGLYLLKSFRIGGMYVQNTGNEFTTTSDSMYGIDLNVYKDYIRFYKGVESVYFKVYLKEYEYILNQNNYPPNEDPRKYIDCGYIEVFFKEWIDQLLKLFDAHKNDHKK